MFRTIAAAASIVVAGAFGASASTVMLGDATDGLNYTGDLDVQSVDFLEFSLDADPGFAVTSIEITVTSTSGSNLFPVFGLGDDTGMTLAQTPNTNGGNANDGVPITLTFAPVGGLDDGDYVIALGGWKTTIEQMIFGSSSSAFFGDGAYTLSISTQVAAVPLPAGGLLLLTGLGALALRRRRAKAFA